MEDLSGGLSDSLYGEKRLSVTSSMKGSMSLNTTNFASLSESMPLNYGEDMASYMSETFDNNEMFTGRYAMDAMGWRGYEFVEEEVEEEFREWSSDWNISEALSGLNTAIVLSGLMTALDVFAWLRSENKSVRPLGGTRLFVAGTVSFVMLLSLRAYLTEARMRDFWARGFDISAFFFAIYMGLTMFEFWVIFLYMVDGKEFMTSVANEVETWKKKPAHEHYDVFFPMFTQDFHLLFNDFKDHFAGNEEMLKEYSYKTAASAVIHLPMFEAIIAWIGLRECFGKMSSYGARQLSATLGVQVLAFVVIFYWGHYSRHDMLFYIMIVYITIICPTWDIYKTNRKNLVQWRASFIRWKVGQERNEQMEYELAEAEASLEELHSKLQLTNEQMELIQANTDDLNALSGYAIDVEQELQFQQKLGEGAFGIVYLAKFRGETVAVKQLIAEKIDQGSILRFKAEILLLTQLHHPNICQILAAAWQAPHLAIVLEFAHNGDLGQYLKKYKNEASWRNSRLKFLNNIAHGMRYLHNRNPPVMHRDLKTENCLITEFHVLKLSDFGESRTAVGENDEEAGNLTLVGTSFFIAPEVLNGEFYTESCDVFSFAILVCCLGIESGDARHIFSKEMRENMPLTIKQKQKVQGSYIAQRHVRGWRTDLDGLAWPHSMKQLVSACWKPDPQKRPNFEEICAEIEKWSHTDFGEDENTSQLPPVVGGRRKEEEVKKAGSEAVGGRLLRGSAGGSGERRNRGSSLAEQRGGSVHLQ